MFNSLIGVSAAAGSVPASSLTELQEIAQLKGMVSLNSLCDIMGLVTIADLQALEDRISCPDLPADTSVVSVQVTDKEGFIFPDRRVTHLTRDLLLLEDYDFTKRFMPPILYFKTLFKIFVATKHILNKNLSSQMPKEKPVLPRCESDDPLSRVSVTTIPMTIRSRSVSPQSCSPLSQ
jgi:hypothetical protein